MSIEYEYTTIDVDILVHEKALAAGVEAMGLWLWGMAWSHKTGADGRLPTHVVFSAWAAPKTTITRLVGRLVASGLWLKTSSGWEVWNYGKKNQSSEEKERRREQGRERMRRLREKREKPDLVTLGDASRDAHVRCQDAAPAPDLRSHDLGSDAGAGERASAIRPPTLAPPPPEVDPSSGAALGAPGLSDPPSAPSASGRPPGAATGAPASSSVAASGPPGAGGPPSSGAPSSSAPAAALEHVPRAARDIGTRRYEQGIFTAAFARGVREATGAPFVVARKELGSLDDAIDAHAPSVDVDARQSWVEASACAYRRAIRGREEFHGMGGAAGWLAWLNAGAPTAEWLALKPNARDDWERDRVRRERAEEKRAAERARRLAEPPPPVDPPIDGVKASRALLAFLDGPKARSAPASPAGEPSDPEEERSEKSA